MIPSRPVTGAVVVRALIAIVLVTMVLPPAGAWWLNTRRLTLTTERVMAVRSRLEVPPTGGVVCGPGRLPQAQGARATDAHLAWVSGAVLTADAFGPGMLPDAWGHCFLMNDHWILSAGPNGIINTPLDGGALVGDDIGVKVGR
jgi:hypothetical protein